MLKIRYYFCFKKDYKRVEKKQEHTAICFRVEQLKRMKSIRKRKIRMLFLSIGNCDSVNHSRRMRSIL